MMGQDMDERPPEEEGALTAECANLQSAE